MKDNGRRMQIIKSEHNVLTLSDGVPSAVLYNGEDVYIRVFPSGAGVKLFVGLLANAAESKAYTLTEGIGNYDICSREEVVVVYGGDAELMY